jgi:hypothetical protein
MLTDPKGGNPYRQDVDALQARCETLEKELADLRVRSREFADLQREEARVAQELEASRKMLGDKRALPLLDNVRVASPCKASWEAMSGDDRVRFCGQCEKNVYNLSAMSREDGERLLREKEDSVCVRFYRRADGTVMTTDCPVGARRKRVRRAAIAVVGGGLMATGVLALAAPRPGIAAQGALPTMGEPVVHQVMGAIAPMPLVPPVPPPATPTEAHPETHTGHVMGAAKRPVKPAPQGAN